MAVCFGQNDCVQQSVCVREREDYQVYCLHCDNYYLIEYAITTIRKHNDQQKMFS